jgi:chloramphenicol 3-O-phosphotransferase
LAVIGVAGARIIMLNGVGSVGKTSVARALQTINKQPFLLVRRGAFLDMLPAAMVGHPDGITFDTSEHAGVPCVATSRVLSWTEPCAACGTRLPRWPVRATT